ncbi:hypothetical protein H6P81_003573 [Aristolochia fimbriata]|uniref:Uncharacterized protein n=1 Tax=Aristolochia fimbriata TaxID=158543 RepID=A0AAV7FCY7_ARIFI|nr:hypothetical protein H6P81_003573 [Aristolochia fimbriata]
MGGYIDPGGVPCSKHRPSKGRRLMFTGLQRVSPLGSTHPARLSTNTSCVSVVGGPESAPVAAEYLAIMRDAEVTISKREVTDLPCRALEFAKRFMT